MKAITIWQPHASYIPAGFKRYETRSWSTNYRGLIAIHSAKKWTDDERMVAAHLHDRFPQLPYLENPPLGCILGVARLVNVHPCGNIRDKLDTMERALGGYADGRFAWELRVVEVFDTPIPAKGQQGLWQWDFPDEVAEKRIAIVGSREYQDLDAVKRYVNSLPLDTVVISGNAGGVDKTAEAAARERGLKVVSIPVDTRDLPKNYENRQKEYGRRAMVRNGDIIALAGAVTAFWDGSSTGTKDSIDKAKAAGKAVLLNPAEFDEQKSWSQLTLDGFFNHYDESAYIEHLVKAKKLDAGIDKHVAKFEWEKPWLVNEDYVWVKNMRSDKSRGYYQNGYRVAHIKSKDAKVMSSMLIGIFYNGETMQLREWLDNQLGWLPVPFEVVDVGDLDIGYFLPRNPVVESVPMEHIALTQDTYRIDIVRRYMRTLNIRDDEGNLPHGVRFSDAPTVYFIDGHHRYIWHRWVGRKSMFMEVSSYPETFAEACGLVDDESEKIEFYADVLEEALAIINGEMVYE